MKRRLHVALAAAVALTIFATMALAIRDSPPQAPATPPADANDLDAITTSMFDTLVIPFELLGVLLTAAMVGALVIARPLSVRGREESSITHPNLMPLPAADVTEPLGAAASPADPSTPPPAAGPEGPA